MVLVSPARMVARAGTASAQAHASKTHRSSLHMFRCRTRLGLAAYLRDRNLIWKACYVGRLDHLVLNAVRVGELVRSAVPAAVTR
jgi:hypothetical protein